APGWSTASVGEAALCRYRSQRAADRHVSSVQACTGLFPAGNQSEALSAGERADSRNHRRSQVTHPQRWLSQLRHLVSMLQLHLPDRSKITSMPYRHLDAFLNNSPMAQLLRFSSDQWYNSRNNGDLPRWRKAYAALPDIQPGQVDLQTAV